MCFNGLGIALYNGAQGLYYYASQAGRIFASNGGVITSVAVGTYFYPRQTAAAVVGVVATRGATWLTRTIDESHYGHLADVHDWLLKNLPNSFGSGYFQATRQVRRPQQAISSAFANDARLNWVNDAYVSELISPVVEEAIFRVALQKVPAEVMITLGMPPAAANSIAGMLSATLFAGAHNPDPSSQDFRQLLVSGIGFGIMMYSYGLPSAVLTHSLNNFSTRVENELM